MYVRWHTIELLNSKQGKLYLPKIEEKLQIEVILPYMDIISTLAVKIDVQRSPLHRLFQVLDSMTLVGELSRLLQNRSYKKIFSYISR